LKIYKLKDDNVLIVLVKLDLEGLFVKFGGKLSNVNMHTRNERVLKKLIANNRDAVEKLRGYLLKIIGKNLSNL